MRCDEASERMSLALDGALDGAEADRVDDHVAGCAVCRSFRESSLRVRQHLRYESWSDVPDVETRVLYAADRATRRRGRGELAHTERGPPLARSRGGVARRCRRRAAFIGVRTRRLPDVAVAADLSGRVLVAQQRVDALDAKISSPNVDGTERAGAHLHAAAGVRRTRVARRSAWPTPPSTRRRRGGATTCRIVVDRDQEWRSGPAACPRESQPTCTPAQPRILGATAREPFPDASPAPLDLVVPVGSFAGGGASASLGSGRSTGTTRWASR